MVQAQQRTSPSACLCRCGGATGRASWRASFDASRRRASIAARRSHCLEAISRRVVFRRFEIQIRKLLAGGCSELVPKSSRNTSGKNGCRPFDFAMEHVMLKIVCVTEANIDEDVHKDIVQNVGYLATALRNGR
ncbi:hypothetical protein BC936DRAFT_141708 [Jimgerdemannia flammicorona]|uniref:Uncharacterized protein n=1 Tax=Jimgerdemannia flammicorona TaxID=994334 RepID=A0A433DFU7_9FUNG|nr:hypothetical protein BC936DRAFT_141708 [Jimgerdemannia flammicorona]